MCIIADSRVKNEIWNVGNSKVLLHLFEEKFEAFAFLNFVNWVFNPVLKHKNGVDLFEKDISELDPVGSTVRYEMMNLCTGSV